MNARTNDQQAEQAILTKLREEGGSADKPPSFYEITDDAQSRRVRSNFVWSGKINEGPVAYWHGREARELVARQLLELTPQEKQQQQSQ